MASLCLLKGAICTNFSFKTFWRYVELLITFFEYEKSVNSDILHLSVSIPLHLPLQNKAYTCNFVIFNGGYFWHLDEAMTGKQCLWQQWETEVTFCALSRLSLLLAAVSQRLKLQLSAWHSGGSVCFLSPTWMTEQIYFRCRLTQSGSCQKLPLGWDLGKLVLFPGQDYLMGRLREVMTLTHSNKPSKHILFNNFHSKVWC